MGKCCLHASSYIFDWIIIKVAGNQDRRKSLFEFDFGPNQTTHFGVTCPWVTKISLWTWIHVSLKPVGQSWSNFMCSIIGVGERLHKVLGQIGSLRWAIVALWATCLDLSLKAIWVVCHHFYLLWTDLHFILVVVVLRKSTKMPASSSSSAFTKISSAKQKLVISRPPMLTLRVPSWSSNVSHMILSRKMLKRVGESKHPCRTPTVVLNHSPVLPLNRTALWALSYTDFQWLVWCWLWCCISSWLPIRLRAIPCQRLSWSLWRHGRDPAEAAGISRRGSWD